mmetsp:Transcript_8969/g.22044  ORF Transcript_8969/g.22044 Transcript_8969/m.22044 type:complete len:233 (-) Transcript_8969:903-1601(-)
MRTRCGQTALPSCQRCETLSTERSTQRDSTLPAPPKRASSPAPPPPRPEASALRRLEEWVTQASLRRRTRSQRRASSPQPLPPTRRPSRAWGGACPPTSPRGRSALSSGSTLTSLTSRCSEYSTPLQTPSRQSPYRAAWSKLRPCSARTRTTGGAPSRPACSQKYRQGSRWSSFSGATTWFTCTLQRSLESQRRRQSRRPSCRCGRRWGTAGWTSGGRRAFTGAQTRGSQDL